jgi:hypothetical protein
MTSPSASTFTTALASVVNAYRLGMEGLAGEQLVGLIDAVGDLLGKAPPDLVLKLNPILTEALGAIERKDYLWAADIFEYEIAPLLEPLAAPPV